MKRVAPIAGLALHLGRGVQRIAPDTAVGRLRSQPRTVKDLDAKALSAIMGRTVTSVTVIGGDAGTSSRARLALTELGRLAETETRFYSQLAPQLTGVPKSYGSSFDPLTDSGDLWDRYRQGALYAYVAALITAGLGGMHDESIALEGLRRAVAALEDLDTVALLEKSL
jgi:hypothetical protein